MGLIKHNQLVKAVLDAIELRDAALCWKMQSGMFRNMRGGNSGKIGRPGVPDICGITRRGYFLGIEVKVGRDKQRRSQLEFQQQCNNRNAYYIVFTDKCDIDNLIGWLLTL